MPFLVVPLDCGKDIRRAYPHRSDFVTLHIPLVHGVDEILNLNVVRMG